MTAPKGHVLSWLTSGIERQILLLHADIILLMLTSSCPKGNTKPVDLVA